MNCTFAVGAGAARPVFLHCFPQSPPSLRDTSSCGSPAKVGGGGKKLAFARRQILQQSSTLIVHLYFSSTLSFCTFLKKYQKQGSRVRHSVLPLFKSCFATSFSRFTPRRSLLVAMLGVARTRCAQTSYHLFPSIARLLAVPPNAALPPLAGNYICCRILRELYRVQW